MRSSPSCARRRFRERPVPERHRLIFYLGHLEAFDANLILRDSLGRVPTRPDLDRLFAFGIDPLEDGLPADGPADWPHLEDVRRYNACERSAIDAALSVTRLLRPPHPNLQDGWAVHLAIEHRLMHAETLAYLLHQLPYASKRPGPVPVGRPPTPPRPPSWSRFPKAGRGSVCREDSLPSWAGTTSTKATRCRSRSSRSSPETSRTATSWSSCPRAAITIPRSGGKRTGSG